MTDKRDVEAPKAPAETVESLKAKIATIESLKAKLAELEAPAKVEYPKTLYSGKRGDPVTQVVETAEAQKKLGAGWKESPAELEK